VNRGAGTPVDWALVRVSARVTGQDLLTVLAVDPENPNIRIAVSKWRIVFTLWSFVFIAASLLWIGIAGGLHASHLVGAGFGSRELGFIQGFTLVGMADSAWRYFLAWRCRRVDMPNRRLVRLIEVNDWRLLLQFAGAIALAFAGA
jgi:hypothetical protein